jgi:hypothetical protein
MLKTEHLFSKKYLKKKMKGGAKKKGGADEDDEVKIVTIEPNPNSENTYVSDDENMEEIDVEENKDDNEINEENEQDENKEEEDDKEDKEEDDEEDEEDDEEELEIIQEDDDGKIVKKDKTQKLLPQLFGFRDQMKLYHWQTLSHARHVASDDFVTNLTAFIDQFIEVYQGKYGRIKLGKVSTVRLEDIDDDSIIDYLKKYRNYLTFTLSGSLHDMKDTDLLNIRDEMLADVNKTLYLFSLK